MTLVKAGVHVFSVTELNQLIRGIIEQQHELQVCYVTGEISNFKYHSSGHMYFTLKDEKSRLRAVMFSSRAKSLAFLPKDGMRVIVFGNIGVFDRDGQYQMYVEDMQPDGLGALYVAFTQLKERLEREGLFSADRKQPLPKFPRTIGVVTSPTGAVIRDICSTLARRYPLAKVVLSSAAVQGPTAAGTIVSAIHRLVQFSTEQTPIDVIIVARGGGSLEELWPFNEEIVARAIANCSIPVVSAVGHETDYTICDFVADVRAATPTAAAEVVAPYISDLRHHLGQWEERTKAAMVNRVQQLRQRISSVENSAILKNPLNIVHVYRQHVDFLDSQLQQHATKPVRLGQRWLSEWSERLLRVNVESRVSQLRNRLDNQATKLTQAVQSRILYKQRDIDRVIVSLEALNPLSVLRRGYSVVYKADGETVVTSPTQVAKGESIRVRLADGVLTAQVMSGEDVPNDGGVQSKLNI